MELTILGTGNALVTRCYQTCFALTEGAQTFLVDGGGGSGILTRLEQAQLPIQSIHHIFVTHKHIDHILGVVWMMRVICQYMRGGKYEGEAWIYSHGEVIGLLREMAEKLLQKKDLTCLDSRLHLVTLTDGEGFDLLGHPATAFDIQSTKAKQFGFTVEYAPGKKLTCCGDEPCAPSCEALAEGSEWLLHEAFCLASQAERFKPYEKHHSTARDAGALAQRLGVKNLLLYHTEDENLENRKALYSAEAGETFRGTVFVPEDLERLKII